MSPTEKDLVDAREVLRTLRVSFTRARHRAEAQSYEQIQEEAKTLGARGGKMLFAMNKTEMISHQHRVAGESHSEVPKHWGDSYYAGYWYAFLGSCESKWLIAPAGVGEYLKYLSFLYLVSYGHSPDGPCEGGIKVPEMPRSKWPGVCQASIDALDYLERQIPLAAGEDESTYATVEGSPQQPQSQSEAASESDFAPTKDEITVLRVLAPRHIKAYQSYELAVKKMLLPPETDREAYDWLKQNLGGDDYKLPNFLTWQRYVRAGRRHHNAQKNRPRHGRPYGGTIVRDEET